MTSTRYVLFDLDGTLIDSSEGVIAAVNHALVQTGHDERPAEEIRRYIGSPLDLMFRDFTDHPYEELRRHFQNKAKETVVASTSPLPGVVDMLEELHRAGYRMGIATTKIRPHVRGIIEKFGWQTYFTAYAGSDDVRHVKPAPDVLHLVLEQLGADPESAVLVGDTVHDLLAARAVPMRAVLVASPFADRAEVLARQPETYLESIGDLPAVLQTLWSRKVG